MGLSLGRFRSASQRLLPPSPRLTHPPQTSHSLTLTARVLCPPYSLLYSFGLQSLALFSIRPVSCDPRVCVSVSRRLTISPFPRHVHLAQALAPLIACALLWVGSSVAHTILAGLAAASVFPYVAASSGEKGSGGQDVGWPAFRHAIPRWGQYWHRSCGRVYEVEGPESWVR